MTSHNNTQQFIKQLADREGVSEEKIKEIIIESFRKTYCQEENSGAELHFEFDSGLSVYRLYNLVETVNSPEKEITKDSELLKKGQKKGDKFFLPLDIKNLSFSINQEIKYRLKKDVRVINREKQYELCYNLYKSKQGEIVKGSIKGVQEKQKLLQEISALKANKENVSPDDYQKKITELEEELKISLDYYLVDLGGGSGHWKKSEWVLSGEPRLGQRFYFLIKEVREKAEKGIPQIILTRSDELFICKLLEKEVPQVKEGTVAVHDILRLPGLISKVIVEKGKLAIEKGLGIDPAGTCIGEGGERAKSISRLIYPERIDFADLPDLPENPTKKEKLTYKKKLLSRLLSPVKVKLTIKNEKEWEIIVHQKTAALLLQQKGEMLKKISDYLGVKIHAQIVDEPLEDEGQVLQEIGNYKNINVQIVDEMEK